MCGRGRCGTLLAVLAGLDAAVGQGDGSLNGRLLTKEKPGQLAENALKPRMQNEVSLAVKSQASHALCLSYNPRSIRSRGGGGSIHYDPKVSGDMTESYIAQSHSAPPDIFEGFNSWIAMCGGHYLGICHPEMCSDFINK